MAIPFSRKYLAARSQSHKKKIFTSLILTQATLACMLAMPITLFHCITASISPFVSILFFFALTTGACVNEAGRFFWNVGFADIASRRNFFEAIIFVVSILGAVAITGEVVSWFSLGAMIVLNLCLLNSEMKQWGIGNLHHVFSVKIKLKNILITVKRVIFSVKDSAPQVIHIQILSLSPFLERLLIEKKAGLELVGSYSFQYSIIQSGVSLLLIPLIADTRKMILKGGAKSQRILIHKSSVKLLFWISLVSLSCAVITYFLIPFIVKFMHKSIVSSYYIFGAALVSAIAGTYTNAVAPLYASRFRLFQANIITLLCMTPIVISLFAATAEGESSSGFVMLIIGSVALLQLGVRMWFHYRSFLIEVS